MQDSQLTVKVELESSHGFSSYASVTFNDISTSWQQYTATLTASATDSSARLAVKLQVRTSPHNLSRPMCSSEAVPEDDRSQAVDRRHSPAVLFPNY